MLVLVGVEVSPLSHHSFLNSENETEVSFFSRKAYESFKLNPEVIHLLSPVHHSADLSPLSGTLGYSLMIVISQKVT